MDLTQLLSEDVLADLLRRVAPRDLAACRCACKALHAFIDARRLLRADLLPLSVRGIFINFHGTRLSELFARPSMGPAISGRFDYLPRPDGYPHQRPDCRMIKDHCNGLLLLGDHGEDLFVVNPAIRQWESLPQRLPVSPDFACQEYLVFDPMMSSHYEVFVILIPRYKAKPGDFDYNSTKHRVDPAMEESEWPPSVCAVHVFSSRSCRWEERPFVRQGKAAGTVADMRRHCDGSLDRRHAVYYRDVLYVHCKTDFVMRISLSNDKYRVIHPPMDNEQNNYWRNLHLGQSEKGVYLASIHESHLQVWVLEESCGETSWALTHNKSLTPILDYDRPVLGPWVLQDINFNEYLKEYEGHNERANNLEYLMEKKLELNSGKKELVEEKFDWDSENDNVLPKEDEVDDCGNGCLGILGFHPYKEIVFLDVSMYRGLAYHLKDSKVQDLGYLYPTTCHLALPNECFITESFPYTPCWIGHQ